MNTRIIRSIKSLLSGAARIHFSQYGEDIFLHKRFRKSDPLFFYVDIGAHHPYHLSNTNYLWTLGWSGINVDASASAIECFKKERPNDLNIHAAVVDEETAFKSPNITFYSQKAIDNCATCDPLLAKDRGLTQTTEVPCLPLSKIIHRGKEKFNIPFGLLNIDIEGLDDQVIRDINNWPEKPKIIMIEIYGKTIPEILNTTSYHILLKNGYSLVERISHTSIFELHF